MNVWSRHCSRCGILVHSSCPHETTKSGDILCNDCAFIRGIMSEKDYLSTCGIGIANRAVSRNGRIYFSINGSKFPWEKSKKQLRHSPEYSDWRKRVFERDNYTCARCGKRGGELNAHHIMPYSKHEDLRLDIDNGITLCEKCHREVHNEKCAKWIHT